MGDERSLLVSHSKKRLGITEFDGFESLCEDSVGEA